MTQHDTRLTPASAPRVITDVVAAASGREDREDPVLQGTGGPAGNARLTAWTGLVLLVVFLAEMATLLSVSRFISWHIVIGVLLVPPSLLKTGSTGWRILRYYTGNRAYRHAGPPPLLLRALGPLVVLGTLAVLGSGLALIALGPDGTHQPLVTVLGQRVDALTVHQACFVVWGVATGLHVLARTIPAVRIAGGRTRGGRVHGEPSRLVAVALTLVAGAVAAALVLGASGSWTSSHAFFRFDREGVGQDAG